MVISVGSAVKERGCAAAGILPAHWFNTRQSQWKQVLNQLEPRSISWQHKSARLLIFTLSRNHSCNICPCILTLLEHWKHTLSSLFVVFHSSHQQSKNHTHNTTRRNSVDYGTGWRYRIWTATEHPKCPVLPLHHTLIIEWRALSPPGFLGEFKMSLENRGAGGGIWTHARLFIV